MDAIFQEISDGVLTISVGKPSIPPRWGIPRRAACFLQDVDIAEPNILPQMRIEPSERLTLPELAVKCLEHGKKADAAAQYGPWV